MGRGQFTIKRGAGHGGARSDNGFYSNGQCGWPLPQTCTPPAADDEGEDILPPREEDL